MACVLIGGRKLKAANSNPEAPERKVQRGSASSDELMVDSAAPSWGQNIQKMMICMMGKIYGTADEIMEVKTLATNAKNEAAEASTAVNLLRDEVDTIKKDISELQGRRPGKSEPDDEKNRTITFGRFAEDTKSEYIIETVEKLIENFKQDIEDNGIVAYGKKFATMGAVRFKTEEAMWMYLKHENEQAHEHRRSHALREQSYERNVG